VTLFLFSRVFEFPKTFMILDLFLKSWVGSSILTSTMTFSFEISLESSLISLMSLLSIGSDLFSGKLYKSYTLLDLLALKHNKQKHHFIEVLINIEITIYLSHMKSSPVFPIRFRMRSCKKAYSGSCKNFLKSLKNAITVTPNFSSAFEFPLYMN
jgi:hypothetical protein